MSFPYPLGSLKAPLTPTERAKIVSWLAVQPAHGTHGIPPINQLSVMDDVTLIGEYNVVVELQKATTPPGVGVPKPGDLPNVITNPFKSVTDFLNLLSKPEIWLRIAEAILGIVLINVSVMKLAGTSPVKIAKGLTS